MKEGNTGILSKVAQEILGPRRGLYLICFGVITVVAGCCGTFVVVEVTQEMSPGTVIYDFMALLSLDTCLMFCGGIFLLMGGGIYALISIRKRLS